MRRVNSLALVILVLFSILSITTPTRAAWIDDWIDQRTTTSPDYFEGQKRHYGTLGGFSARWQPSQDHLFSIAPPKFKTGCGGIDVFMGGFSFLNADYLVQKLQNMMNAAPAVAFDMALETLCSQCAKALKSLEAISDRLNQLQFDDCKASKAVVATIADGIKNGFSWESMKKSQSIADFVQSTGIVDLWKEITDKGDNHSADQAMQDIAGTSPNSMVSSCPTRIKDVFFTTGYILDHLATIEGFPTSYAELMRGYVGDVSVDGTNITYEYVPPCPKDSPENIRGLVDGEVWIRPSSGGACVKQTSITINGQTYPSVRDWVFSTLTSVCQSLISRSALTSDQQDFIKVIPIPVYNSMVADVAAAGPGANASRIAEVYTDTVATAYAYVIITDLYDTIRNVLELANHLTSVKKGAQNGNDQNHCHIELAEAAKKELGQIMDKMTPFIRAARKQYVSTLSELVTTKEYNSRVREATSIIHASIAKNFGEPLARKVSQ